MSRKFVSKRHPANGEYKVTLFPFLAVLLCTMGALIMLLVVIARNVREQSVTVSADETVTQIVSEQKITDEQAAEILEQIKLGTEEAEWFAENLNLSKKEVEETLAEKQTQLALAEKETQKVHDEIERLAKLAEQLERNEKTDVNDVAKLKSLLEKRKQQQQKEELELAEIQKESANSKKSYAIIPYRGTAGTYRRPIYIECCNDKVIIQPEGVELTETDFLFANRPDNPLDTVLRVIRQYYLETNQIVRGTEPYPLLIVRPSGVETYEATRRAIGAWIQEFGYELVEEDSKIEYPKPSEELKKRIEKQLEISRYRLAGYLNAMQAEQTAMTRAQQYRLDHRGNVQPSNDMMPVPRSRRNERNNNRGTEHNRQIERNGYAGTSPPSYDNNSNNNKNNANDNNRELSSDADISLIKRQANTGNIPLPETPDSIERNNRPQQNFLQQNPTFGTQTFMPEIATEIAPVIAPVIVPEIVPENSASINQPYGSAFFSQQQILSQQGTQNSESSELTSELTATDSHSVFYPTFQSAAAKSTSGNQTSSEYLKQPEYSEQSEYLKQSEYSEQSEYLKQQKQLKWQPPKLPETHGAGNGISSNRQENWALRDAVPFSTPVSRNIKIQCEANQFVLVPQTGLLGFRVVPITNSVYETADKLVTVIWEFMDSWGIAGEKMYWRPVLQVKVLPGGEQRFQELKSIFQNSGIVIVNSE
ncbi:MAG: hypothetical protein LBP87_13595 [Planctomycetaceae bacterium]|jgi:hypothetical protein|nr:hypothetical protein [Planctomycetaceae bacterium]